MPDGAPRKDRLIQTRVARELETTLKDEARRRRLTVSHLIRSILEDAFHLVDDVVADVDEIVGDSARLASRVRRNARRLVGAGRERSERSAPAVRAGPPGDAFPDVYAFSELVLHRAAACDQCGRALARGERGFFGLSDRGGAPRACLCAPCVDALRA